MLEIIFVDLPLLLLGYAGAVFLILKYLGDEVHDAAEKAINIAAAPGGLSQVVVSATDVNRDVVSVVTKQPLNFTTDEVPGQINLDFLPTDCLLRRHYLTNLLTIATSIHPRPEEATLKRHQRQQVLSLVESMLEHPETIESLEARARELSRVTALPFQALEPNTVSTESMPSTVPEPLEESSDVGLNIPEESTLRRHFIQHCVAKLEEFFPRPTDSTLSRHYDQWLEAQIEGLLSRA